MKLSLIFSLTLALSFPQKQFESLEGFSNEVKINIIIHLKDQIDLSNIERNIPPSDLIILLQNYASDHQRDIM
jgi:hypothetical protein